MRASAEPFAQQKMRGLDKLYYSIDISFKQQQCDQDMLLSLYALAHNDLRRSKEPWQRAFEPCQLSEESKEVSPQRRY